MVVDEDEEDDAGHVEDSQATHAEGSVMDFDSWDSVHRTVQAPVASRHRNAAGEAPAGGKGIHPEGTADVVGRVIVGAIAQLVVTELILGLMPRDIELEVDS